MSEECEDLGWFECLNLSVDIEGFDLGERNFEFEGWWHQASENIQHMGDSAPWNR